MEKAEASPDEPVPESFTGSRLLWFVALLVIVIVVVAAVVLLGLVL